MSNLTICQKFVYAYKNKKAGVFYVPFVADDEPDKFTAKLQRTCKIDDEASKNLAHLQLYCLGTYDDLTGNINPNIMLLADIDDMLPVKEVVDGKGN